MPPYIPDTIGPFKPQDSLVDFDAENLQSWGMNHVRLGVMWEAVEIAPGVYNETYVRSQDFELWLRLIRTTKPAIIEDVLVMRHEYKGVALSTTSAAVSQFVNGVKLRLLYIVSEKSYSLLPYFFVGTTYHLWNLLKNVTSIK